MKLKLLVSLGFFSISSTALAEESIAEETSENEWAVGISGGIVIVEQSSDQKFANLSVSKDIGDSYLGLAISFIDSGNVAGLINNVPASTTEVTLSAGASWDSFNLDAYASIGDRNFDVESIRRDNGLVGNIDSGGNAFGIGLSASYDFIVGDQTFITPMIGVDYNSLDIARLATGPNGGQVALSNEENGVTGTFGVAVQHLFGTDDNHLVSVIANLVTTSNTTSFNPGNSQNTVLRALALRDEPGQKDSWGEVGGSLSFGLNKNLRFDVSLIQTIGFLNSDATSISSGLRYSF